METTNRKSSRPKSRQSLAHVPSTTSPVGKDNMTADIATLQRGQNVSAQMAKKKSRGKSLGPGGLEALQESSGNATKSIPSFQIKSILKPTVPLTPPKVIPSFDELRKKSTGKSKSPVKTSAEELLIDFSTPGSSKAQGEIVSIAGTETVLDPFSPMKSPATGGPGKNNAQTEVQERETELKRQAEKQAILDRRAARRKSLANRRVSFAPEATLHTWSVMELAEDSTTSSASNSTRRQSSMVAAQSPSATMQQPDLSSEAGKRPVTPPEQADEPQVRASPTHQRDLHRKKRRRRSSALQNGHLDASMDNVLSSSPSGDVTADSSPICIDDSVESDGSDTDEGTAMSMDESTSHTMNSQDSGSSTRSSLDERLRRAANQAGTRGIDYDEHGDDLPMELATATITHAFQQFRNPNGQGDSIAMQDQENVNPFSTAFKAHQRQMEAAEDDDQDVTQDMSMDVTSAIGGIVAAHASPIKGRRKSVANRRRSNVHRRRSSGGDSADSGETMDFTAVGGGILASDNDRSEQEVSDEDMTMEFTNVIGGLPDREARRESIQFTKMGDNETMDMTTAVGGILAPIEEQTEPQTDAEDERTVAMEMTRAVGAILPSHLTPQNKNEAKYLMQEETDAGQLSLSPRPTSGKMGMTYTAQQPVASITSETGSPNFALKPRLSGRARQSTNGTSTTPRPTPKYATPTKSATKLTRSTPTKQLTPLPSHADTPNRTPLSANVTHRGASPKKLFKEEIKAKASPGSSKKIGVSKSPGIFARDEATGHQTPSVVLKAPRLKDDAFRRSSGVGIDQEGFGSPRVSDLLDRRASIGDAAPQFRLDSGQRSKLRFDNPREIQEEVEAERAEEQRRESGRFIMEQEANEQQDENATLQLKEMIESMTPKKAKPNKLKGRKSLAVGAAKGLLGKRPAELDLEEDADLTPKRLKAVSREASPIKKVHLPRPPSKEETTGRLARAEQVRLNSLVHEGSTTPASDFSPARNTIAISPHLVRRFKDLPLDIADERPESFEDKLDNVVGAIDVSTVSMQTRTSPEEKISLQSFLNMTNIHFIELSTTKRRHTMAPATPARPSQDGIGQSFTESNFVAAAITLPLLELYQHATRELKSYISAGRKIIRSIEAETLTEQPPLFREYVDARPDIKSLMDNQFRNGKSNARLQSKEGWYTWRAQLVQGLKNGLEGIKQGMLNDGTILDQQRQTLDSIVPDLSSHCASLQQELVSLEKSVTELESVDREVLDQTRCDLQAADKDCLQKSTLLANLKRQMADKEDTLASAGELKMEMLDQIAEADRVRQEHRGWPAADVAAFKAKAKVVEHQSGWNLVNAEEDFEEPNEFGVALTMTFKKELRLFFYPSAFETSPASNGRRRSGRKSRSNSGLSAPISLKYTPEQDDDAVAATQLSTERRFFLQLIRSQLHAHAMMPQGSVMSKTILQTVSRGWGIAGRVSEEIRLLDFAGVTTTSILGDEILGVKVILISQDRSRIDVEFNFSVTLLSDGDIAVSTTVSARGVYGFAADLLNGSKGEKVQQALTKEIEGSELGCGAWVGAVHGFEDWIHSQKAATCKAKPEALPAPVPTASKKSPLAPKKTKVLQKKTLPVPKHRVEKAALVQQQASEKENVPPPTSMKTVESNDVFSPVKPAIPPKLQEAMMHTPIKRVGALRRSPV